MNITPLSPELLRGIAELEQTDRGYRPHRLPAWVRQQFPNPQLLAMEGQPSGVRLSLRTTATHLELVTHSSRVAYRGAIRPRGCLDVLVDGALVLRDVLDGGDEVEVDLQTGAMKSHAGEAHTTVITGLPEGDKRVEVWLPHNESLELVELRSDGAIRPDTHTAPLWVHHGSSISHGSNAASPTEIWPVVAAKQAGVDLRNLGLGGSAIVDQFLARVIRDAPADLISVKLGINVVNLDAMRVRAFVPAVHGFLDTIRDRHPTTPIVLISPIFCGIHEHTSGPGMVDPETLGTDQVRFAASGVPGDETLGRLTLSVIRRELQALAERRSSDANLHYLDGTALYSAEDSITMPLPDGLHPDTATHRLIGERFASYAFAPDGIYPLATTLP